MPPGFGERMWLTFVDQLGAIRNNRRFRKRVDAFQTRRISR